MEHLLSRQELAERLGVSVQTVDRMTARGELRVHRIGRAPKFLWSDVLKDTEEHPLNVEHELRRVR